MFRTIKGYIAMLSVVAIGAVIVAMFEEYVTSSTSIGAAAITLGSSYISGIRRAGTM